MSAETLQRNLWVKMRIKITVEEAQAYLDNFFKTYPGVLTYIHRTQAFVSQFHFTYTYTGRQRRLPISIYSRAQRNRVARQAVNARIQTTSSDLVEKNMINLHKAIKSLGGRIIITVHDSMGFQLPKGSTGVKEVLDNVIIHKTQESFPWLPVVWKYDCERGESYGEAKYEVT